MPACWHLRFDRERALPPPNSVRTSPQVSRVPQRAHALARVHARCNARALIPRDHHFPALICMHDSSLVSLSWLAGSCVFDHHHHHHQAAPKWRERAPKFRAKLGVSCRVVSCRVVSCRVGVCKHETWGLVRAHTTWGLVRVVHARTETQTRKHDTIAFLCCAQLGGSCVQLGGSSVSCTRTHRNTNTQTRRKHDTIAFVRACAQLGGSSVSCTRTETQTRRKHDTIAFVRAHNLGARPCRARTETQTRKHDTIAFVRAHNLGARPCRARTPKHANTTQTRLRLCCAQLIGGGLVRVVRAHARANTTR